MFRICKAQISNKRLSQLKVVFFFFTLYDLHRIKCHLCVLFCKETYLLTLYLFVIWTLNLQMWPEIGIAQNNPKATN